MRVQTDSKNKTFQGKPLPFPFKNAAVQGPNLPRNDLNLLDIVPGSVVFWLENA